MSKSDFVIVGSGIAGLSAAVMAAELGTVTLITKEFDLRSGNSFLTSSGIAASKNIDLHFKDTLKSSSATADGDSVAFFVANSWNAYLWLKNYIGVTFQDEPKFEGGHSENRTWVVGDRTGEVIVNKLIEKLEKLENVKVVLDCKIDDLIINTISRRTSRLQHIGTTHVSGVSGILNGEKISFLGENILLATGGIGQKYGTTTNPYSATGDGIELAKQVGAEVDFMNWISWYPTCLRLNRNPVPALADTLRGDGAFVVNRKGERFLKRYHEKGELAPNDVISNAIFSEEKKGHGVYLDLRHKQKEFWTNRYPHTIPLIEAYGIDISKDLIPIAPAVDYSCGGIKVDKFGKTTVAGLYAIGEVAYTGLHGMNPLPSNSLTECIVWARSFVNNTSGLN